MAEHDSNGSRRRDLERLTPIKGGALPGPIFYAVAVFQSLGFHVPYFLLPEYPLRSMLKQRDRRDEKSSGMGQRTSSDSSEERVAED